MKKSVVLLMMMALILSSFSLVYAVDYESNLLINGDGDSMDGWTDPNGDLWGPDDEIEAFSGSLFLWPKDGARGTAVDDESYIYQDISLAGFNAGETAVLKGWLANYDQSPHDRATLKLSLLDNSGNVLAEDYRMQRDPEWHEHVIFLKIPNGAVTARVTLIATRFVGSDNDAYFDMMIFMVSKKNYNLVTVSGDKETAQAGEMVQCVANNNVTTDPSAYEWSTSYSESATVDATGKVTMLTNDEVGIYAKDKETGLSGVYWINSDKQNDNNNNQSEEYLCVCNFETAGGQPSNFETQVVKQGEKIVKPDVEPTRDGLPFLYWATLDEDGQHYTEWNFDTPVQDDMELVAQYGTAATEHQVTFLTFGGQPENIPVQTVAHGAKATVPSIVPTREGEVFAFWTYLPRPGEEPSNQPYNFDLPVTEDLFLAAHYQEARPLKVIFETGGGTPASIPTQYVAPNGYAVRPADPQKPGYIFNGWELLPKPGDANPQFRMFDFNEPITEDIMLMARYKEAASTVQVRFDTNGGTPQPPIQNVALGGLVSKPAQNPQKAGHTFVGWVTAEGPYDFSAPLQRSIIIYAKYQKDGFSNDRSQRSDIIIDDDDYDKAIISYIEPFFSGYPDGTFGPNKTITRAELATVFARVLNLDTTTMGSKRFSDMNGHWAAAAVSQIADYGIIKGYPDGTFQPNKPMKRAEIAAIINNYWHVTGFVPDGTAAPIADIKGHWAEKLITALYNHRFTDLYIDKSFKPDAPLQRADVAQIMNRITDRPLLQNSVQKFSDVRSDFWGYNEVNTASSRVPR